MMRNVLRLIFLALAIWGAIHPMYYFVSWFQSEGWALSPMIDAWYVNDATSGLVWDLTIAAIALSVWVIYRAFADSLVYLVVIPATFCIGVSCGLPLYFFIALSRSPARAST